MAAPKWKRSSLSSRRGNASRSATGFVPFSSWPEVLAAARRGDVLYYWAPLDRQPVGFRPQPFRFGPTLSYLVRPRSIRMWPLGSVGRGVGRTSDPFTANAGHLDRFYRKV